MTQESTEIQGLTGPKVDIATARQEVESWLDYKKVGPARREQKRLAIESLAESISEGSLVLDQSSMKFRYALKFPIKDQDGEAALSELVFMPRIRVGDVTAYLKKIKPDDLEGNLRATGCALTRTSMGMMEKLDSEDADVMKTIALFFV